MATTLGAILTRARVHLIEPSASFWSDDELLSHAILGCQDLWKAIIDTFQDHFLTVDETNVSQVANGTALTGVPADCFRIRGIEPRVLSSSSGNANLIYRPLDFTHADFVRARAASAIDASSRTIYYDLIGAGAPVAAPTIRVAPATSADVLLRLIYIPTLPTLTDVSINPIPGESDNAVMAWVVAYARAKEREDRAPDVEWLGVYATEKQGLLRAVTPRQDDEDTYVEAIFEPYWDV